MFFRDSVGRGLVEDHGGSSRHGRIDHGSASIDVLGEQTKQTNYGTGSHDPTAVVALKVVGVDVGFHPCFKDGELLKIVEKGV